MPESDKPSEPVVYLSDGERVDKYLRVVSIGYDRIASYWRSNPPDKNKQPITSALVAAYVTRLEFQATAARNGLSRLAFEARSHPEVYAEIRELGSWMEPLEPSQLKPKVTDENENELGDFLVAHLGFSYSEANSLLRSQRRSPQGAPNKRAHTLKMLDARLANGWSYAKLASKMCDCALKTHNELCRDRIRKRIKELESILPKYGIRSASDTGEK